MLVVLGGAIGSIELGSQGVVVVVGREWWEVLGLEVTTGPEVVVVVVIVVVVGTITVVGAGTVVVGELTTGVRSDDVGVVLEVVVVGSLWPMSPPLPVGLATGDVVGSGASVVRGGSETVGASDVGDGVTETGDTSLDVVTEEGLGDGVCSGVGSGECEGGGEGVVSVVGTGVGLEVGSVSCGSVVGRGRW